MTRTVLPIIAILYLTATCNGQIVANGDFEAPAIVGPGQTPVAPGQGKSLNIDPLHPLYPNAIAQIPNWVNSYTDVACGVGCRDAGLSRVNFDGSGVTQYALINNWETRLSQVTSRIVQPGDVYTADILIGLPGYGGEAGRFQLWAGAPSPANPDVFPPTAVLLAQTSAANPEWNIYVPNLVLTNNEWHQLELNYVVPSTGSMIGQPLTLSFLTSQFSVGPTFWDDARLTVVPEPSGIAFCALAVLLGILGYGPRRGRHAREAFISFSFALR